MRCIKLCLAFVACLCIQSSTAQTENLWLHRTDGSGINKIEEENIQLLLPIDYSTNHNNAEIYNNPCCLNYFKNCSYDNFTTYPIPFENQMCIIANDICQKTPSPANICNLVKNTEFFDAFDNPMQMIKDNYLNLPYKYKTATFDINFLSNDYKNGTYGYGFWNTKNSEPKFIWFMNYESAHEYSVNGFFAMVCENNTCDVKNISHVKNERKQHNKKIIWNEKYVEFFINNESVFFSNKTIDHDMNFHVWIDNVEYNLFGIDYLQNMNHSKIIQVSNINIY